MCRIDFKGLKMCTKQHSRSAREEVGGPKAIFRLGLFTSHSIMPKENAMLVLIVYGRPKRPKGGLLRF